MSQNCVRYYIPRLLNNLPHISKDKLHTWSCLAADMPYGGHLRRHRFMSSQNWRHAAREPMVGSQVAWHQFCDHRAFSPQFFFALFRATHLRLGFTQIYQNMENLIDQLLFRLMYCISLFVCHPTHIFFNSLKLWKHIVFEIMHPACY